MHITHVSNHILDIVVTWSSSDIIISEIQASLLLLDHCFLECNLSVPRPNLRKKEIQFRKMTHIDVGVFKSDIFSCNICNESRAIAGALLGGGGGGYIHNTAVEFKCMYVCSAVGGVFLPKIDFKLIVYIRRLY